MEDCVDDWTGHLHLVLRKMVERSSLLGIGHHCLGCTLLFRDNHFRCLVNGGKDRRNHRSSSLRCRCFGGRDCTAAVDRLFLKKRRI